jgi:hypothetical protein
MSYPQHSLCWSESKKIASSTACAAMKTKKNTLGTACAGVKTKKIPSAQPVPE